MATIKNKFGTLIGWNHITMNFLGRDIEGFTDLEYTDEWEMTNEYGGGSFSIGQAEGNYSAKASFSLYIEESIALQKSIPPGTYIQQISAFDISVVYEYEGTVFKDVIRNCKIKNNGRSLKQGDGKVIHKYEILCSHIDYNV